MSAQCCAPKQSGMAGPRYRAVLWIGVASIMGVLAATSARTVVRAARLELRQPVESGA